MVRACTVLISLLLACSPPATPPKQRSSGPGGADYVDAKVLMKRVGSGATAVRVYEPDVVPDGAVFPLVVFLHGYQATSESYYEAWLEHLVRHRGPATPHGSVVIFPAWQVATSHPETFTPNAAEGIHAALKDLEGRLPVDLSKVIFVTHSGGGPIAMNLSAWSTDGRLQVKPRAVAMMAPGRCILCNQLADPGIPLEDFHRIPDDIALVILNSGADETVGQTLGRTYFEQLTQIPRSRRIYLEVQDDPYGDPQLKANHRAVAARYGRTDDWIIDAIDFYGSWKLTDALISCVFAGEECEVALGEGAATREMGVWSDGTPVTPMVGPE